MENVEENEEIKETLRAKREMKQRSVAAKDRYNIM